MHVNVGTLQNGERGREAVRFDPAREVGSGVITRPLGVEDAESSAQAGLTVATRSEFRERERTRTESESGVPGITPIAASTLAQFVRDIANSTLDETELLRRLAAAAADFVQAEGTCVLELDDDSFRVVATSGHTRPFEGETFRIQPAPSLFREVIAHGGAVYTNQPTDPRIDPRFRNALNISQAAVVPIMLEGAVSGLLLCINTARGAYTTADIELLGHLADYSAIVLRSQRLVRRAQNAVGDARLRAEDAARAAQHNAVLARTARTLADAMTREAVYSGIAKVLCDELHAAGFSVFEANPQLRTVRLDHQSGAGVVDGPRVAAGFYASILGDVVDTGTPRFISDLTRRPDLWATEGNAELREAGVAAVALLPLMLDGEPRGVLSVRYIGAHEFDDYERSLLQDIATHVAIAYRNLRHLAELERRADRLAAMARAQQQLALVTTPDALPTAIAEATQSVIPSGICDVFANGPSGLTRVLTTRDGMIVPNTPATDAELALARETLRTGVSRLAVHALGGPHWSRGTSELCATVRYGTRSAGVLRLVSASPDAFDLQDLDLLTILARQAGAAVEASRLFTLQEFQRQRAEGAAELARVTLHAVNVADGALELLRVLDRFVPSIGKAIGVARARDGVIEYVATSGTLDVLRGLRPTGERGESGLAHDGRPRELASLREIAPSVGDTFLPDEWGFVVPLIARDRTIGVLVVSAPRSAPLPRRDRVTLERLSTSLALALDALLLDEDERLGREREHLLATALTTIDHPIFILDRVGVRYANPAAAREYGWSQVELMDMQFEQVVVGVDTQRGRRITDGVVDSGLSLIQHIHRRRDESEFPATVTISPLLAQDGEVLGQVVSVRNVSADRRLEEQLRHTEKMVALGELVAGVAHEINNPLTGISAFAQMLLEESLGDEQRESVQLIKQESDRAKAVIRDLLIFARKTEPRIGPVDLNDLIEQTLRLRSYPLRHAGVRVVLEKDQSAPDVSGDVQKLQQVLLNLIGNAEHAMVESTERVLTLRTEAVDDVVRVIVTDTGRGMQPEVRRRIFEPFFTTKPAGVGTGLGLSVSYGIVQAHGGRIDVQSESGVGTTVIVSLPVGASVSSPVAPSVPATLLAGTASAPSASP